MCRFLVKYTLFFVNFIFTLIGLALIGLGVAAIYQLDEIFDSLLVNLNLNIKFLPYVIIGVGGILFLIAFCGCCGPIIESKCLLITYAIIMGIMAAAKIYLVVQLLTQSIYLRNTAENFINNAFDDPAFNRTFHVMEAMFSCCGTTGPGVYNFTVGNDSFVPPTCCGHDLNLADLLEQDNELPEDLAELCTKEESFEQGCTSRIGEIVETWSERLGYILIGIIAFEMVALVFASFIASTIKRKY